MSLYYYIIQKILLKKEVKKMKIEEIIQELEEIGIDPNEIDDDLFYVVKDVEELLQILDNSY